MEPKRDKTTAEMYEEDVNSMYEQPPADKKEPTEPEKKDEPPTED